MAYWLFKSEPDTYSIQDLEREKQCPWEGVRNLQARNFLRDSIKIKDTVLFYHSGSKHRSIVGLAEVIKDGYPDTEAFNKKSQYFDPKSDVENPKWYRVDIKLVAIWPHPLSLDVIKAQKDLQDILLIRNSRLSVQPLPEKAFKKILKLSEAEGNNIS